VRELTDPDDGYAGQHLPPEEIFSVRRARPQRLLHFIACHPEGRSVVGFKIFRDHLRPINWHKVISWCDVCVVLHREDVAAQYESLLRARRTGIWKSWKATPSAGNATARGGSSSSSSSSSSGGSGGNGGGEESGMAVPNSNIGTRYGLGVGGSGRRGFMEWRANQDGWYAAISAQLARRGANATILTLSYGRHLTGPRGADLARVWDALQLSPPPVRGSR
jgi:hypothetical protein